MKNQIHALLTAEGMEDVKGSLQSKRGRKQALDTLKQCENGLVAQPLIETIDRLEEDIKRIEKELRGLVEGDRMVELLMSIPGCGEISAWTIRAWTDDIKRFSDPKKYASFAGLAPWVQDSNESIHHGRITKRGPKELRTGIVQVVMGLRRMKEKTFFWRFMQRYEAMKKNKGSGRAIIATARKVATMIWHMLTEDVEFDLTKMVDKKLAKKSEAMRKTAVVNEEAPVEKEEVPVVTEGKKKGEGVRKNTKNIGVASKKRKKSAKVLFGG